MSQKEMIATFIIADAFVLLIAGCQIQYNPPVNSSQSNCYYLGGSLGLFPIDSIMEPDSRYAYSSSFINCVDCTYYGTNVKPAFWP